MARCKVDCSVCGATHVLELDLQPGQQQILFSCPDVDRRHRLMSFYVDSRRGFFDHPVGQDLAEEDRKRLQSAFGERDFDAKFRRWKNIAYPPIGLIDEYPEKLAEIINAYSTGYAYPVVTSACCLGERVLNRLVLRCRDHFRSHPEYKKIYRNQSFDDWERMLRLIEDWRLISPKGSISFEN